MQNTSRRKGNVVVSTKPSKKNKKYNSVKDYFSDLEIQYKNFGEELKTHEDYIEFFKCVSFLFKEKNKVFDYNHFQSSYDLIEMVDKELKKMIGYYKFNRNLKQIEYYNSDLNGISLKISMIQIGPFFNLKNYVSKKFWNHCGYLIYKDIERACETECYGHCIYDFYLEEMLTERLKYEDDEIIKLDIQYEIDNLLLFKDYVKQLSEIKHKKWNEKSYSKEELELINLFKKIAFYNYTDAAPLNEIVNDNEECWGNYEETNDDDIKIISCERFYSGSYAYCLENDDSITNEYLSWVNDMENNCLWDSSLSSKICVSSKEIFIKHKGLSEKIVQHYDNYHLFNDLIKQYFENRKNSSNVNSNNI